MSAYDAIIAAFPADIEVTRYTDQRGDRVDFRVASPSKIAVKAEIERISGLCAEKAWLRLLGPFEWSDGWVAYGELRERIDQ